MCPETKMSPKEPTESEHVKLGRRVHAEIARALFAQKLGCKPEQIHVVGHDAEMKLHLTPRALKMLAESQMPRTAEEG